MKRLSTTLLINLSLVGIVISAVLLSNAVGWMPNDEQAVVAGRLALCESIGMSCSQAVGRRDVRMLEATLAHLVSRNDSILAARVKSVRGNHLATAGDQKRFSSGRTDVARVPIMTSGREWGGVEIAFAPPLSNGIIGLVKSPALRFALCLGVVCGCIFQLYLKRTLQHLDPTSVVPDRVRTTLDTLAEGLVVLDKDCRIVLANSAFANKMELQPEEMIGWPIDQFEWLRPNTSSPFEQGPWWQSIANCQIMSGILLQLELADHQPRKFRVSCSPVINDGESCEGALVSFDDVTALEARTAELTSMLGKLKESRDRIRRQNQQLVTLATRDPLTGSFNRRSLFEKLEQHWKLSTASQLKLCCIMIDIDHFKSINDTHGHARGDLVLKKTVELLQKTARPDDVVARFGGEEFCIITPNTSLEECVELAGQCRAAIEKHNFAGVSATASFGVAERVDETHDPADLIECADRSLYVAKRTGRNRVVAYPQIASLSDAEFTSERSVKGHPPSHVVPHQSVAALTAALAYRDVDTAQHSRRVADYCFRLASQLMSISESYALENAALLHDIGKIGVPDSILLKPGPLTADEWEVMRTHDEIGIEIIRSTFACDEMTKIVEHHHTPYREHEKAEGEDKGLPLGARILTIADSYDAMISDRVYRQGLSQAEAFAELRRCSGEQFDPALVEQFIAMIEQEAATETPQKPVEAYFDKQTALHLGIQLEGLADAVDRKDCDRLAAIADAIAETARERDVPEIARLAEALRDNVENAEEWIENLAMTIDLMELCRLAQQSHLRIEGQLAHRREPVLAS